MTRSHGWWIPLMLVACVGGIGEPAAAQADADGAGDADDAQPGLTISGSGGATQPAAADNGAATQPATPTVADPDETPTIAPTRQPSVDAVPSRVGAPATKVDVDRSVLGLGPGETQPMLRREGEFVVHRQGRIVRHEESGRLVIVFSEIEGEALLPPMVLQACRDLKTMEDFLSERGDAITFTVSGQVHTYRGINYLMPTIAAPPVDRQKEEEEANDQSAAQSADDEMADEADGDADDDSNRPSVDDVDDEALQQLLEQREAAPGDQAERAILPSSGGATRSDNQNPALAAGRDAVRGSAPGGPGAPGAESADAPDAELRREGELIVSRRGYLKRSPEAGGVMFVFEADDRQSPEPPMILQACQLLQKMEAIVRTHGSQATFIISGEVHTYRGANYLLPTMMKLARDTQ